MPILDLEQDFVPLTEFRNNASPLLRRLREGGTPVVVTHNGRPAAVMVSVQDYQKTELQIKELKAMVESLADALKGKTIPSKEAHRTIKDSSGS